MNSKSRDQYQINLGTFIYTVLPLTKLRTYFKKSVTLPITQGVPVTSCQTQWNLKIKKDHIFWVTWPILKINSNLVKLPKQKTL